MSDLIERQVVENAICNACGKIDCDQMDTCEMLKLPSAQPERLTDDDFETIRIHLNAFKEKLCNQHRWEEANEYQRILDRFMSFASAQPDSKELSPTHKALDTISRQDAIRIVDGIDTWQAGWRGDAIESMKALPSAQPETHEERTETHACDLISRKATIDEIKALYEWHDTVTEDRTIDHLKRLPSAQPEQTNSWYINSWCNNCKEYDTENKCCPRYNRVIKQTLDEVYAHAETEAEARYHAQQRWIPCSERLPAYGEDVLISIGGYCNVGHIVSVNEEEQYNWYFSGWYHLPNDVDAWMPLPEPYAERRTDGIR